MTGKETRRAELSVLYRSYSRLQTAIRRKREHEEAQKGETNETRVNLSVGAAAESLALSRDVQDCFLAVVECVDGRGQECFARSFQQLVF